MYDTSNFHFEDNTGAFGSCSAIMDGRMLVFGGDATYGNQISEVANCGLSRIGKLPLDFSYLACNTFNGDSEYVLLCFPFKQQSGCHRFDGTDITADISSNYNHYSTSLGRHGNNGIIVGGYRDNNHVEKFTNNAWIVIDDFGFVLDYISDYSMVSLGEDLYLFGKCLFISFQNSCSCRNLSVRNCHKNNDTLVVF